MMIKFTINIHTLSQNVGKFSSLLRALKTKIHNLFQRLHIPKLIINSSYKIVEINYKILILPLYGTSPHQLHLQQMDLPHGIPFPTINHTLLHPY